MFNCKRCEKVMKQKVGLIKHLEKSTSCIPLSEEHNIDPKVLIELLNKREINEVHYDCSYCKKQFNQSSHMYRHQKICKLKSELNSELSQENNISNVNNSINSNISNIQNSTIVNQPVHITINALGNESKSYLNESLIKNIFLQRFDGLLEAFRQKHLNNSIPENNNLRKQIHKDNFIESYDGEKWNIRTFETVLNDCFKNMGFEIFEFLRDNRDINLNDMNEEQKNNVLNSFMHYIGKPLNWNLVAETDIMKNYKDNYNHIDPLGENKKKKTIYKLATENVYQYSNQKKALVQECPF